MRVLCPQQGHGSHSHVSSNNIPNMILHWLYSKPSIKDLSDKRRIWAKMNKYCFTPDDQITSETKFRQFKVVESDIRKRMALVRSHKIGISAINRLRTIR